MRTAPGPGCGYQELLSHVDAGGLAVDYRVPVCGEAIPYLTLRTPAVQDGYGLAPGDVLRPFPGIAIYQTRTLFFKAEQEPVPTRIGRCRYARSAAGAGRWGDLRVDVVL